MATSNLSTCLISPDFGHYNITDLPDSVVPVWTVLASVNGIAAPFTVIFNALIIWTVFGDHQLRSNSHFVLLVALSVSDFLVGLLVEPLYCWFLICTLTECGICVSTMSGLTIGFCSGFSAFTLTMASVERYLAVKLPFWHRAHVTAQRVKKIAMAVWLTLPTTMVTFMILLNKHENLKKVPSLRFIAGNVLVTLFCTVKVAITAYSKKKAINPIAATQHAQQEQHEQQKRLIQEYKRALTLAILVFASVMFYFPIIIVNIIQSAEGKEVTLEFKYIAQHIVVSFVNLQSLINPFIVTLRIEKIRKRLKTKILSCFN